MVAPPDLLCHFFCLGGTSLHLGMARYLYGPRATTRYGSTTALGATTALGSTTDLGATTR